MDPRQYQAFDYEKQEWIEDNRTALETLIDRCKSEIDLLSGPKGEDYYRFIRTPETPSREECIEINRRDLDTYLEALADLLVGE